MVEHSNEERTLLILTYQKLNNDSGNVILHIKQPCVGEFVPLVTIC
jgi:hypothetical protein